MSERSPRVTVALAVHNERRHLRAAVESVLAQSFTDFELVVVDDGSSDSCLDTIADITDERLVVLRQANQGKSVALNTVLDAARGEYVCLQDGDDLSYPERLATQVAALDAQPELGAVFCRHALLVDDRATAPRVRGADPEECAAMVQRGANPALDPTIMFRRSATSHLRFDPELRIGQGVDHILRIGEQFPLAVVDGCHYGYRVHEGNRSKGKAEEVDRYYEILRRKAAERRGTPLPPRPPTRVRPQPTAGVTGDVIVSSVELAAMGKRREAVVNAARHLRGIWRYPNSWLPLVYALTPAALLKRNSADYAATFAALGGRPR